MAPSTSGTFVSASDIYGVTVEIRGAFTALVSTSKRRVGEIKVRRVCPVADDYINRGFLGVITAGNFSWISPSEDRLISGMKMEWVGKTMWRLKTDAEEV